MRSIKKSLVFVWLFALTACQNNVFQSANNAPTSLRTIPSVRLNFRYEGDVPAPTDSNVNPQTDEINPAVRAAFEATRGQDVIARTIIAPNQQRILVAYNREGDLNDTYRLDMFAADGSFLRRITPDAMSVVFPQSIVWSPDSSSVAFTAITREGGISLSSLPANTASNSNSNTAVKSDTNSNTNTNANVEMPETIETPAPVVPQGDAPPNVLTFRTEQIYTCSTEGTEVKPLTQTEGLIYYYFAWSPDSSMLVSLASRFEEWRYLQFQASQKGEHFVPLGRPRIIEKSGRERRLDDNLTAVHPVWSPDSAKVAVGFKDQIRVYDAIGDAPTQAAIPVRNQLLISSQTFDRQKNNEDLTANTNVNTDANANTNAEANTNINANVETMPTVNPNQPVTILPDETTLVSYQPIINLNWSADNILYFQTGYVREYANASENRYSSLRWHRLIFSPQIVVGGNK